MQKTTARDSIIRVALTAGKGGSRKTERWLSPPGQAALRGRNIQLAVRNEYRAQQWAMVVQECASSGLSNREFCRQRGIAEKSFYYWQRKLRTQIVEAAVPKLVPFESVPDSDDMLQIQYRGAELKLPVGVDIEAVAALLRSIQSL